MVTLDTTDQFWARRRLALLNKAGMRIGSTLDVGRTAEELAELAVEDFADFVTVDLLSEVVAGDEARSVLNRDSISFHRAAQCSVLEGCPESIVAVGETHAYDSDSVVGRTLIKGEPARMVLDEVALRRWRTIEPVRSQSMRDHKIHSVMVVPLRARGVILGTTLFSPAPHTRGVRCRGSAARGRARVTCRRLRGQRPPLHTREGHRARPATQSAAPKGRTAEGRRGHRTLSAGHRRRGHRRRLVRRHPAVRRTGRAGGR